MFEEEAINEKACEHCNEVMCSVCEHKTCENLTNTHRNIREQLIKAKELIENIIRVTWGEGWNYSLAWKVKAEQFIDGYNKANEWRSPEEHIDKDKVVLGIIKHCNKSRYSLVQWNGEWWYQYGTYNTEVRLIAWCEIPVFRQVIGKL